MIRPIKLTSQCHLDEAVQTVLDRDVTAEIRDLLPHLANCPDYEDSLALVYHKLGVNAYYEIGLDSAIWYMQKAQAMRARLYADEPTIELGKSSHNLGRFYNELRDYRTALLPLQTAVNTYQYLKELNRLALSQLQLAQAYNGIGAFEEALTYIDIVILNCRERGEDEILADAQLDKGLLFLNRGEYQRALPELQAANAIYEQYDWSASGINTVLNLGLVYDGLGEFSLAERYLKLAIQHYDAFGDESNKALTQNNLGLIYVEKNRLADAYAMLQQGLESARLSGVKSIEAQALDHLGEYYYAKGQVQQASAYYQQAQQLLMPEYLPDTPLMVPAVEAMAYSPNQLDMLIYLSDQAKALSLWYEQTKEEQVLNSALEAYEAGNTLIDFIRQEHSNQATKLFWRKEVLPFYESAIRLCYQSGRATESFHLFERSKAILLLESLLENDAKRLIPDSLQTKENQLQRSLNSAYESLSTQKGENRKSSYEAILQAQRELKTLRTYLSELYPHYQELTEASPVPTLTGFQTSLLTETDQVLVHYFFGEEEVYALVVDHQSAQTFYLGDAASLRTKVGQVLAFFTESSKIENDPAAYTSLAYDLYQHIIEPLGIPAGKQLLIIPDGPLTYLPFAALATKPDYAGNIGTINFLIHRNPSAYAHSASILEQQAKRVVGNEAHGLLAFAPFADGTAPVGYARLSYSQDELQQISSKYRCELYENEQASLANWMNCAKQKQILHLSTHAFSSPQEQSPHIAFYDSLLYLRALYLLPIHADLVVLSACQTNIGPLAPGEGVLGLGRGFIQAGAGSIIASLWNVNAQSTGYILAAFYDFLSQNSPKDQALHLAQCQYLSRTDLPHFQKSPYYWAGLTYYGDQQKLKIGLKKGLLYYLSIGGGALLLVLGSLWSWRKFGAIHS